MSHIDKLTAELLMLPDGIRGDAIRTMSQYIPGGATDDLICRLRRIILDGPIDAGSIHAALVGYIPPHDAEYITQLSMHGMRTIAERVLVSDAAPLPVTTEGTCPEIDAALLGYDGPDRNRYTVCMLVAAVNCLTKACSRYSVGQFVQYHYYAGAPT